MSNSNSHPPNPLRSHPHTEIRTIKSERTTEWARSLTPLPPSDGSESADFPEEARDRSRFSDTIVRLTTSPEVLTRGDEERPWSGGRDLSGERSIPGSILRPMSDSSQGGLLKAGSGDGSQGGGSRGSPGEKKNRIRMLTDEERMRKEIEMLETPQERIGGKRPGGWRWWFGID